MPARPTRRAVLVAAAATGAVAVTAGVGLATGAVHLPARVRLMLTDTGTAGVIPDVPQGRVRLEHVVSAARGRTVGLWTAVPDGHGDGAGLGVCLVLHGATATTADYTRFGLAKFLTAAVRAGVPPFVLAGADAGLTGWVGDGASDDPQRMLREEMPRWCADRGWDPARLAAYGWSLGGFGSLLMAERSPGSLRGVSALSPAVAAGDAVVTDARHLDGRRTALWCGESDPLLPAVKALAGAVPGGPAIAAYSPGAHTRAFWNRVTPAAYAFVGAALAHPAP